MSWTCAHTGDVHVDEDRYFGDTAQCLEWFVADAIGSNVNLFVINGDLTTYKATIKERNLWIDMLIRMANHAPVVLIAGNHGAELTGDLYVYSKAKGKFPVYLCTEPEFIEFDRAAIAVFPYPRKAEFVGTPEESGLQTAFLEQLEEFIQRFARRSDCFRLFFGHFGVTGARVSSGQPLVGRCAEYPLDPLRRLQAQYVGLSHIHLRQQLAPRVWYAGSLSRCDYSEEEDKGYHLVTVKEPRMQADLSDLDVDFRVSPTRRMVELQAVYENGDFRFRTPPDPSRLRDARVKLVVSVPKGLHISLAREEQDRLRERLLEANPAELKVKIEREPETEGETTPLSAARTAEDKLRAYWVIKSAPPVDQQQRLLSKLAQVESAVLSQHI
ncbi:MAG TPA: metallophosphoesterase [Terriglobia bacterium]|jgi:DNA repair exonuclease SbcCD nuclease subunit|nr:metallophosphoesterase [Terriglobia bacterium]